MRIRAEKNRVFNIGITISESHIAIGLGYWTIHISFFDDSDPNQTQRRIGKK